MPSQRTTIHFPSNSCHLPYPKDGRELRTYGAHLFTGMLNSMSRQNSSSTTTTTLGHASTTPFHGHAYGAVVTACSLGATHAANGHLRTTLQARGIVGTWNGFLGQGLRTFLMVHRQHERARLGRHSPHSKASPLGSLIRRCGQLSLLVDQLWMQWPACHPFPRPCRRDHQASPWPALPLAPLAVAMMATHVVVCHEQD